MVRHKKTEIDIELQLHFLTKIIISIGATNAQTTPLVVDNQQLWKNEHTCKHTYIPPPHIQNYKHVHTHIYMHVHTYMYTSHVHVSHYSKSPLSFSTPYSWWRAAKPITTGTRAGPLTIHNSWY